MIWCACSGMTVTDDLVRVFWYDCDCEWVTKYCEEFHRRSALVPRGVLG
jgi:hypothetical protein